MEAREQGAWGQEGGGAGQGQQEQRGEGSEAAGGAGGGGAARAAKKRLGHALEPLKHSITTAITTARQQGVGHQEGAKERGGSRARACT